MVLMVMMTRNSRLKEKSCSQSSDNYMDLCRSIQCQHRFSFSETDSGGHS